ncbi:MAG: M48 family metalloprotease [Desulfosalsimonadaceae bacterium]
MFGNFLYYIVALLIYSTYQPAAEPEFSGMQSALLLAALSALFFIVTWWRFKRFERLISRHAVSRLDDMFQTIVTRQSILAIIIYALDIYILQIGNFFTQFQIVKIIPTLEALIFFALFISYLSLVWVCGYPSFIKIYRNPVSMKSYVISNISFAIPVVMPWLFLSLTADLIQILPFEAPRRFLMSSEGQIAYFMFFLFVIAVTGPLLIQKFWGCRPLRHGVTRFRIESLCKTANMKYRDILIWPLFGGRMITAGVMGLVRQFRYILVTPALLCHLEPLELDAVIAHEIGHIKKNHLLYYLMFFAGYLVVSFTVMDLVIYAIIYAEAAWGDLGSNSGSGYTTAATSISFSLMMIGLFIIYFRYLFGYFMRNFERQADLFAYATMNTAQPLISTFEKITQTSGQSPDRPNWHHFSITERIAFLKRIESNPSLVNRHHGKIKKSMAVYLAGLLLVGWIGWELHYSSAGEMIGRKVLKAAVLNQIAADDNNPELYQLLGDIFLSEENYDRTIQAYEHAIRLAPDNIQALNNLAWLYATCENTAFRNPKKALDLARRAAGLSRESYVMDTLAESYYASGDIRGALTAAEQAIANATENRAYYRRQVEKFQAAAKKITETERPVSH